MIREICRRERKEGELGLLRILLSVLEVGTRPLARDLKEGAYFVLRVRGMVEQFKVQQSCSSAQSGFDGTSQWTLVPAHASALAWNGANTSSTSQVTRWV